MTTTSDFDLSESLFQLLVAGDEQQCRELVFASAECEEQQVQQVCDSLADAFHRVGDAWECSEIETYKEHVATQIGNRILFELRDKLGTTNWNAPRAIGCTPEHDPYSLPTLMVELVLKDLGWAASSLGTNLPLELLEPALDSIKPELCWVSISYIASFRRLKEQLHHLGKLANERGVQLICGGQAISEPMLHGIDHVEYVPELSMLQSL